MIATIDTDTNSIELEIPEHMIVALCGRPKRLVMDQAGLRDLRRLVNSAWDALG